MDLKVPLNPKVICPWDSFYIYNERTRRIVESAHSVIEAIHNSTILNGSRGSDNHRFIEKEKVKLIED